MSIVANARMLRIVICVVMVGMWVTWAQASQRQDSTLDRRPAMSQSPRTVTHATIIGTVADEDGRGIGGITARARSIITGEIGGSAVTTARGEFAMAVPLGTYVIEIVDSAGQIVRTSPLIAVSAAASVKVPTMIIPEQVGTRRSMMATGTAVRAVLAAAVAAGVAGVVVPPTTTIASPSR